MQTVEAQSVLHLVLGYLHHAQWFLRLYGGWWDFGWALCCLIPLHRGGAFFNRATCIISLVASLHAANANPRLF